VEKIFDKWRVFLKEFSSPSALRGTLAGIQGYGRVPMAGVTPPEKDKGLGKDTKYSVKLIGFLNDKILMLKNSKGWDLPGGHRKEAEDNIQACKRESYEETGVRIMNIVPLNLTIGKKTFYRADFETDDFKSLDPEADEHSSMKLFTIEDINKEKDITDDYRAAIQKALQIKI
tara:strand:- start:60 stop:578 length:519 start_codon:yes stop_codon:yes gene_type:complete